MSTAVYTPSSVCLPGTVRSTCSLSTLCLTRCLCQILIEAVKSGGNIGVDGVHLPKDPTGTASPIPIPFATSSVFVATDAFLLSVSSTASNERVQGGLGSYPFWPGVRERAGDEGGPVPCHLLQQVTTLARTAATRSTPHSSLLRHSPSSSARFCCAVSESC